VRFDTFLHLKQTVALKILKSKKLVDVWKNEFASLEKVVCKHCVRVYGFEWVADRPALILEYVNGISLRQLCLAGPLTRSLAQEILVQIQTGLLSLRDRGLCHGDLSPNNVMIDEEGTIKLLDFGWANSRPGQVQATQAFAAPEILAGALPDFHSDLYSLGVLEEMLLKRKSNRASTQREERRIIENASHETARRELGRRVRCLRDQNSKWKKMATRSIALSQVQRWPIIQGLFLLLIFLLAPASQSQWNGVAQAIIKIRTQTWTELFLDGQKIGFAPQDLIVTAGQKYRLRWVAEQQSGEKTIRLAPDQMQLIDDQIIREP
jgi:serine/threonine protein kinase